MKRAHSPDRSHPGPCRGRGGNRHRRSPRLRLGVSRRAPAAGSRAREGDSHAYERPRYRLAARPEARRHGGHVDGRRRISVSLITDPLDAARVLPAENGIYFALCWWVRSARTRLARRRGPPRRSGQGVRPWSSPSVPSTKRPRRSWSSRCPRGRLPGWSSSALSYWRKSGPPLRNQLSADPRFADAGLRGVVERLTRSGLPPARDRGDCSGPRDVHRHHALRKEWEMTRKSRSSRPS